MIHQWMKQGRLSSVLKAMVDHEERLRPEFRFDANHAYYVLGDVYFRKREFRKAKEAFQRSLKSWPHDVEAMHALGNCYDALGRPKMAERVLRRAIAVIKSGETGVSNQVKWDVMVNLGNALLDQGKHDEAVSIFRRIGRLDNDVGRIARENLQWAKLLLVGKAPGRR